jgi:hypothetical protein
MVSGQTSRLEVGSAFAVSRRASMCALGQKRTLKLLDATSALPPEADIDRCKCHVRFVPIADICTAAEAATNSGELGCAVPVEVKPVAE